MSDYRAMDSGKASRRIGGAGAATASRPGSVRSAWLLKLVSVFFVWPAMVRLLGFDTLPAVAVLAGMGLLWLGGELANRGLEAERELEGRALGAAPKVPFKLFASVTVGLAAMIISLGAVHDSLAMAVLFGALAFSACRLAYGTDPRTDRAGIAAAAQRAGMAPAAVVAAIDEASRKIREIETTASRLHSRELVERLRRITSRARAVLAQIEADPRDISRARRFLVTYIDGTKDVVAKYVAQQHDVTDTLLSENFRNVLETVEQVFIEQEELLKRDERLDLEVQLEVLETQLRREGVH